MYGKTYEDRKQLCKGLIQQLSEAKKRLREFENGQRVTEEQLNQFKGLAAVREKQAQQIYKETQMKIDLVKAEITLLKEEKEGLKTKYKTLLQQYGDKKM